MVSDYYPFGMQMPGRTYTASSSNYRYGFNGKENDNEVKGIGNQQDYGMRIYDPKAGRFLSVDPLTKKYPELTPYQFASNRPIDGIDLDGLEYVKPIPKFNYNSDAYDIPKAFDNAFIDIGNAFIGLWNSGVSSVKSLQKGTYIKDVTAGAKQFGSGVKQTVTNSVNYTVNTTIKKQVTDVFTNPQNLELGVSLYAGSKLPGLSTVSEGVQLKLTNLLTPVNKERLLYRFDSRTPEEIKAAGGFNSYGIDMDLIEHANGNNIFNQTSGYIPTSYSLKSIKKFAGNREGYIYTLKNQYNGINVNKRLGSFAPHPEENEIAVPLHIPASDILKTKKVP